MNELGSPFIKEKREVSCSFLLKYSSKGQDLGIFNLALIRDQVGKKSKKIKREESNK